jgi:hypothetical protein
MNASLARRIRNAEALLISALDSNRSYQRNFSRRYGPAQPTPRMTQRSAPARDATTTCPLHLRWADPA